MLLRTSKRKTVAALLEKLLAPVKTAGTNINTNKNICKDLKGPQGGAHRNKIEKRIERVGDTSDLRQERS